MLWVGLTGAHAYGFPSPDSDLDLKAVHMADARARARRGRRAIPIEHLSVFEGREMDFSSHDLAQVVRLLLRGNGNMLERLGPLNLVTTPADYPTRHLARQSLSRRLFHHYQASSRACVAGFEREAADGVRKAKRLLYAYRVALTGIHALLEGEIETRVDVLAERYHMPGVDALIQVKQHAERQTLGEAEATPHLAAIERLERQMEEATGALGAGILPQTRRRWSGLWWRCGCTGCAEGCSAGGAHWRRRSGEVISLHDEKVCHVFVRHL